jgi:hypothetical protein
MATSSFSEISTYSWAPTSTYETIQSMIQAEVNQGLWANEAHIDGWCCILASPLQGANNSWLTYTYQLISDNTQTATVIWPAGWPAPSENINGQLPQHFFSNQTKSGSSTPGAIGVGMKAVLYETYASPSGQPTYKAAGACL